MEGGCHNSGQLFTAVRVEISQAQVRPAQLFKADQLTSTVDLSVVHEASEMLSVYRFVSGLNLKAQERMLRA